MKHKGFVYIAAAVLGILLFSAPVFATETDDIRRFSGADELLEALPEGLSKEEISPFFEDDGEKSLWPFLFQKITTYFTLGFREGVKFFLKLCAMILFSSLFACIKKSFSIDSLEGVFDFIFILMMALTCYSALENSFSVVKVALSTMADFITASLSVMTLLLSMTGGVGVAAVSYANIRFVLAFFTEGVAKILFPVLKSLFGFALVASFSEIKLQSFFSFFKKAIKTICVFLFTIVSALLALQHALAGASDSLTMRSVRFAAGNFIPVVGSFVGESTKTLSASFSFVKTQCGVVCLLVLLCIALQPILYLWVQKTFLSLGKALGEMLGDIKNLGFLNHLASLFDLMMALMISQSCYFIFYITLFLRYKGSI